MSDNRKLWVVEISRDEVHWTATDHVGHTQEQAERHWRLNTPYHHRLDEPFKRFRLYRPVEERDG